MDKMWYGLLATQFQRTPGVVWAENYIVYV